MAIRVRTRKLLWGKSANRCNHTECRKPLSLEIDKINHTIIGEECHIVAKKTDGPRGNSNLSKKQRDEYNNLILMCKKHHKIIDDNPQIYTVDILEKMKKEHEEWVNKNLEDLDDVEEIDFDYEDIKFDDESIADIYSWIVDNCDITKYSEKDLEEALNRLQYLDKGTRKILYKIINYYYKDEEIDIKSIMNKLVNDDIVTEYEFFRTIEFLEKQQFIEFDRMNENDFFMNSEGEFIDAYSNIQYRCYEKYCYLFKHGYILMLIGTYIDDKKVFKSIIQDLEFEYI